MRRTCFTAAFIAIATTLAASIAGAQTAAPAPAAQPTTGTPAASAPAVTAPAAATPIAPPPTVNAGIKPPADYVVGIDDQLEVIYWQDKDMSAAVVVRPDGNISLPLLNDVQAAGRTPEELRLAITAAATKFVEGPTVSVVVKAINSRKVYITGQIGKPGPYPLMDAMTVVQLIATAGGPTEYAKSEKITILRHENGRQVLLKFNYKNVSQGKSLEQNIVLKPGDAIIVP
jgi:polysaccharide biosynthesis/export protein